MNETAASRGALGTAKSPVYAGRDHPAAASQLYLRELLLRSGPVRDRVARLRSVPWDAAILSREMDGWFTEAELVDLALDWHLMVGNRELNEWLRDGALVQTPQRIGRVTGRGQFRERYVIEIVARSIEARVAGARSWAQADAAALEGTPYKDPSTAKKYRKRLAADRFLG